MSERWAPGELEAVMCGGKARYSHAADAGKAKAKMRNRGAGAAKDVQVYRCPFCIYWHIGRRLKKKKSKPPK